MPAKTLMVQGTASSVGKSLLVAALCRIFHQDGIRVAPFKSQNMALNSFVTTEGGEMGRAQVVQAEAAGIEPSVDMNPILLKPEADMRCQVIVHGKVLRSIDARNYHRPKSELWQSVVESFQRIAETYDMIVIEGAGSPAEVNLKDSEIVNMRVAKLAKAPVLLVGDIDRGGVFASLVGTLELLDRDERELVGGLIINKFRGDISLLKPGLNFLAERTGRPVLGVIPYLHDLRLAEEDSVALQERDPKNTRASLLDIVVIQFPHISNFDDFDPLAAEPSVGLRYVSKLEELGHPDLIILPGSKTTVADLLWVRERGFAEKIVGLAGRGTPIIGICAGYQMLGQEIRDPERVESVQEEVGGLGLLPVITTFAREKRTCQVKGRIVATCGLLGSATGEEIRGYEIHMGYSEGEGVIPALKVIDDQGEHGAGAALPDGLVFGTYIHGLFDNDGLRKAVLETLALRQGASVNLRESIFSREHEYDRLAAVVRKNLDMDYIYKLCGIKE